MKSYIYIPINCSRQFRVHTYFVSMFIYIYIKQLHLGDTFLSGLSCEGNPRIVAGPSGTWGEHLLPLLGILWPSDPPLGLGNKSNLLGRILQYIHSPTIRKSGAPSRFRKTPATREIPQYQRLEIIEKCFDRSLCRKLSASGRLSQWWRMILLLVEYIYVYENGCTVVVECLSYRC